MGDAEEKTGYARVEPAPTDEFRRILHQVEKGGCGADITASCMFINIPIPSVQVDSVGRLRNVVAEVGAALIPMACPACGKGMVRLPVVSPIQVARGLPGN